MKQYIKDGVIKTRNKRLNKLNIMDLTRIIFLLTPLEKC